MPKIYLYNSHRHNNMKSLITVFFFHILFSAYSISFGHEEEQRWILVKGRGVVESAADLAILKLGVISVAKSAQLATEVNNRSMKKIFQELENAGVDEEDIETINFNLNPQREYRKNQPPVIVGYQVSNTLLVEIHDLSKVGEIMQVAIDAGGNNFQSLEFSIANPSEQEEVARRRAVENAVARAETLTESLDTEIGEPLTIQEIQFSHHPQHNRRMMMADALHAESASVPVHAPQDLITTVEVQIKFSLK